MSAGVITPEAVLLELPLAGVATRAFARLVDLAVQAAVLILLTTVVPVLFGPTLSPALFIGGLTFFILLVLPIGTELLWRGRSPGKFVFGLRVVGVDGAPEAPRQAVVRGLVALVDIYASLGFLALITAMFSPSSQRTGDLAAGTAVIRVRSGAEPATPIAFYPPQGYESYVASLDVSLLQDEDFSLIREFLLRAGTLTPDARHTIATRLATSVVQRIRHELPGRADPETWLICVASAYQLRSGGLLADAAVGLAPLAPRR